MSEVLAGFAIVWVIIAVGFGLGKSEVLLSLIHI